MTTGAGVASAMGAVTAGARTLRLLAAGSLEAALGEAAAAFTAAMGTPVETDFAASGLLRERILAGERADVFASANLEHPRAIAAERDGEVRAFARNTLCALVRPGLEVTSDTLLDVMLRDDMRVGTSTPLADPSGDYAFALFDRADAVRPGAAATLKAKALQLTGGPGAAKPDTPRSVYGWVMEDGRADIFLTYRTNAEVAATQVPGLQVVGIAPDLDVGADYGLVVLTDAQGARGLAGFILSAEGRSILAAHGFAPPRRRRPGGDGTGRVR